MNISAERRKWLAERLRKIADEEEARGAKEVAADFRRSARDVAAETKTRERIRKPPR